jgi:tetratricopeptide (TPR) repeat protein
MRLGDLSSADRWLTRAVELAPHDPEARAALAESRIEQGRSQPLLLEQAHEELTALIAGHPHAHQLRTALADVCWDLGDADSAIAHLEAAEEQRPNDLALRVRRGRLLASAGALPSAMLEFDTVLQADPRSVEALTGLATTARGRIDAERIALIEEQLADDGRPSARALLGFALAQVRDAAGDHRGSAAVLQAANATRATASEGRRHSYDVRSHSALVDELIATYSQTPSRDAPEFGVLDDRPVFIVGMPRSGTTLIDQVLSSHPAVASVGERLFVSRSQQIAYGAGAPPHQHGSEVTSLPPAAVVEAAGWVLQQLEAVIGPDHSGVVRIIDKMPDNAYLLGWIAKMFPRAHVIEAARDPRDIALSCWFQDFAQISWANDLDHIAERLIEYERVMAHWRAVLPIEIYEVRYETFVTELEGEARRLIGWLGLDWDPKVLEYYKNDRLVRTASVSQVRQPIYTSSVGKWRNYADALKPVIDRLEASGIVQPE